MSENLREGFLLTHTVDGIVSQTLPPQEGSCTEKNWVSLLARLKVLMPFSTDKYIQVWVGRLGLFLFGGKVHNAD